MKKDKGLKNSKPSNEALPTIDPNSFNQTIIINNPNININYINNNDDEDKRKNNRTII